MNMGSVYHLKCKRERARSNRTNFIKVVAAGKIQAEGIYSEPDSGRRRKDRSRILHILVCPNPEGEKLRQNRLFHTEAQDLTLEAGNERLIGRNIHIRGNGHGRPGAHRHTAAYLRSQLVLETARSVER